MNPPLASDAVAQIRRALAILPHAHSDERAGVVNALARVYLHCELDTEALAEAELGLIRALDDGEPRVRRALAQALASARGAPRHVVVALAGDISAVARIVLAASPLITDEDLVEATAHGEAAVQIAVARRPQLSAKVAAALCEVGGRSAAYALLGNLEARIDTVSLWRLFERFAADDVLRLRFAARPGLTAALRAALAAATVEACAADGRRFEPGQAGRIARDGREQAFVAIAGDAPAEQLVDLVEWLRKRGHLTVGLFLRALAGGDVSLMGESLAQMARVPRRRVVALMRAPRGLGFAALYRRAAMPSSLLPAFRIAVDHAGQAGPGEGVNHGLTAAILREIETLDDAALRPVVSKLWRLAAEGARADARDYAVLPAAEPVGAAPGLELTAPLLLLDAPAGNENFAPPVYVETRDGVAA